eukprot:TRINITY_DN7449_c0_g1_i1.p4 TRINITY_DN7449_c0_g1~~TRINITY_DN7449_c0_g1_i1.p4  ORF type:complete len:121 (+),score=39.96 TRINITY_DN7449_c0_g1_i1:91-453(+)
MRWRPAVLLACVALISAGVAEDFEFEDEGAAAPRLEDSVSVKELRRMLRDRGVDVKGEGLTSKPDLVRRVMETASMAPLHSSEASTPPRTTSTTPSRQSVHQSSHGRAPAANVLIRYCTS